MRLPDLLNDFLKFTYTEVHSSKTYQTNYRNDPWKKKISDKFLKVVLGSWKDWAEGTEIARIPFTLEHAEPSLVSKPYIRMLSLLESVDLTDIS